MCSLPATGYDFDPPHLHSAVMTDLVCHASQWPLLAQCTLQPKLNSRCSEL